jgi:hypothetical protein
VAAFVGFAQRDGGSTPVASGARAPRVQVKSVPAGRLVVITMRGYVAAARTLHSAGGPVRYREAGSYRVVWRVPASALRLGRTVPSTSAIVTGTTSAVFGSSPARSCRGTLTASRTPFILRVVSIGHNPVSIGLTAWPNPIATATSPTCSRGLFASYWRLTPSRDARRPPYRAITDQRRKDWYLYNHPGFGFHGKNFTPLPKGGDSEGFSLGWGAAGSLSWLTYLSLRRTTHTAQAPSYRQVLDTRYTPIPGLFLKAVQPCTTNQFAACRRTDGAVQQAVNELMAALRRAPLPAALVKGGAELRYGLAALDAALALRIRLVHQTTIGPFINADGSIITALNLMDKAAHDLNTEDPHLHLRPI